MACDEAPKDGWGSSDVGEPATEPFDDCGDAGSPRPVNPKMRGRRDRREVGTDGRGSVLRFGERTAGRTLEAMVMPSAELRGDRTLGLLRSSIAGGVVTVLSLSVGEGVGGWRRMLEAAVRLCVFVVPNWGTAVSEAERRRSTRIGICSARRSEAMTASTMSVSAERDDEEYGMVVVVLIMSRSRETLARSALGLLATSQVLEGRRWSGRLLWESGGGNVRVIWTGFLR